MNADKHLKPVNKYIKTQWISEGFFLKKREENNVFYKHAYIL